MILKEKMFIYVLKSKTDKIFVNGSETYSGKRNIINETIFLMFLWSYLCGLSTATIDAIEHVYKVANSYLAL
jgi:hypothetical protein